MKAAAAAARLERAQKAFGTGAKSLVDRTNHNTGATTAAAELDGLKTAHTKALWTIVYAFRRSGKAGTVDKGLGSGTLLFSGDTSMPSTSFLHVHLL